MECYRQKRKRHTNAINRLYKALKGRIRLQKGYKRLSKHLEDGFSADEIFRSSTVMPLGDLTPLDI